MVIIRHMVKDLAFSVKILTVPILRDDDGVANSSRNTLLTSEDRKAAIIIPRSWKAADELFQKGERNVATLYNTIVSVLTNKPRAITESIDFRDGETLAEVSGQIVKPTVLF